MKENREDSWTSSNKPDRKIITGLFKDREGAERAFNYLYNRGYSKDEINLIMSDGTFTESRIFLNNK